MKDRNVNSYDLKQAQQILSALAPAAVTVARKKAAIQAQAAFLKFPQRPMQALSGSVSVACPTTAAGQAEQLAPPETIRTWDDCIRWCLEATRSHAAFVVDSQGFIIASQGLIPEAGFECTGAEMICSLEQLERIDPEAGKLLWIDLDYGQRRIAGLVTPSNTAEYFIVGLVSPDSFRFFAHKALITSKILENLPHID
ncbi:hypothetical protein [Desulfuromonas sp. CSMB_57]|jgi:hypothetical protein|uniref:hypothetical protein n=1 Tax=Desulfuromonas sp. CSMB_57 TaxID=2807629 RepID=UPI001CD8110E|nr:hypothetical protein [Desulfuromonas sp. CSMB_57]